MTMDRLLLEDRSRTLDEDGSASRASVQSDVAPMLKIDLGDDGSGSRYPQNLGHPVYILFVFAVASMILFVMVKKYQDRRAQQERERLENDPEEQARRQRELILREQQLRLLEQQELEIQEKTWLILIEEKKLSKVLKVENFKVAASSSSGDDQIAPSGDIVVDIETGDANGTPATSSSAGDDPADNVEVASSASVTGDEQTSSNYGGIDIEIGHSSGTSPPTSGDNDPAGNAALCSGGKAMARDPTSKDRDDILESSTKSSSTKLSETESTMKSQNCAQIVIPRNSATDAAGDDDGQRAVNNLCAVCLDPYNVGDRIVWSNNMKCQHVFHQTCMLDYYTAMVKKRQQQRRDDRNENDNNKSDQQTICPCCRQDFFVN